MIEQVVLEAYEDTHIYSDRLILDMLETVKDPDCTEREFDVSDDESFNVTAAAEVLHKCKLLVLRNVFDEEFLKEYKANFTGFIQGLKNGNISKTGSTTNNENYFMHRLDHGRWEVLLPKNFAHPTVVANPNILEVLMEDQILGQELNLHSLGTALADSGAYHQDWHTVSLLQKIPSIFASHSPSFFSSFLTSKNLVCSYHRTVTFCSPMPCTRLRAFRIMNCLDMPTQW